MMRILSSSCFNPTEVEKKAISEPEANAEHSNRNAATQAATIAPTEGIVTLTSADENI